MANSEEHMAIYLVIIWKHYNIHLCFQKITLPAFSEGWCFHVVYNYLHHFS